MAVLDRAAKAVEGALDRVNPPRAAGEVKPIPVPPAVKARVKRSHDSLKRVVPRRRQNVEFAANNHYVWINEKETGLEKQSTLEHRFGGEMPDHRVRRSHDILAPIIKGKQAAATQRIPGYEVIESTNDPEDYSAARTSEKVLVAGHTRWNVRQAFRRAVWNALVTEEGFVMPYFDTTVGPYIPDPESEPDEQGRQKMIGMGEVRYAVYSGLEVSWEPGVEFEDSPYYVITHARPRCVVEAEEDFIGPELEADANTSSFFYGRKGAADSDLVMVTDYLERPNAHQPNGRRIISANDRQIFPEEDYPLIDGQGDVVDEPCLRRVAYTVEGSSEHARGLVSSLIETVRDFDFASNKAVEYLQLILVPQFIGPEGSLKSPITDTPGAYIEIDEDAWVNGLKPEVREMPSMPGEFADERDRAQALLGFIASENAIPSQVESGKAIKSLAQKDALAWQDFMEDLADCYAACARDALCLAQVFYTEDRLIQFRGRTGWESVRDFRGADIRGQTDVRVSPGSLEPLTREVIEQRIMNVAEMFPGYFPPEILIAALSAGDFDRLNESFEEDEAQANFIIAQIRGGTFWDLPDRPVFPGEMVGPQLDPATGEPILDPETGEPVRLQTVPGWMPRPFDGLQILKRRVEAFMKSDVWRHLDEEAQKATGVYYQAILGLEAQETAKKAAAQTQMAEALGSQNAAKPRAPKALPSRPGAERASPEGA